MTNKKTNNINISTKDWDRMLDLVMKDDDGDTVAKLIKDKNKAIARFIAGLKLNNSPLKYNEDWKSYSGRFSSLGNKALQLGATPEEIQNLYIETGTPSIYIEKINKLNGKKLNDRFVGDISKAILDMGFDINYLPYNGYAMTSEGIDIMRRNGIKWTIGYKTEITLDDKKIKLNFDAITNESCDPKPTYYVIDQSSDNRFSHLIWKVMGKQEFLTNIKSLLK
jgi:hypothetical protein